MRHLKLWERVLPWGILALAAILRLFRLGKRDFWYDEAFTGSMIRHDWSSMMTEIMLDVHPPLYYFLLKLHASVFGDWVTSLRFFSVVCGVLSVWLVYLIGREWLGRRAGLYASFVAAIAPFAIHYSQETRMYALYALLILFAVYCFLRALRTNTYRWWVWFGVGFALACLTHYMALLLAPCFYAAFVVARFDAATFWRALRSFLPSRGFFLGSLTAALIFSPWLPSFLTQLQASESISNWKTPARLVDIFRNVQIFVFATPKGEQSLWAFDPNVIRGISPDTLALCVVFGLALLTATLFRRDRRKVMVLFTFFAGPLFLSYGLSFFDKYYFISRYVLPSAFFLYLLLGVWLRRLSSLRAGMVLGVYAISILLIRWPTNSEGYNAFHAHLSDYRAYHFYSLNTFDYVLLKYYVTPDRLTLYNTNWPPYDSRAWPGVGHTTKRTERFDDLKDDPQGIVIWNTLAPLKNRDDHNFDTRDFERIATYKNIELYRPRKFVQP